MYHTRGRGVVHSTPMTDPDFDDWMARVRAGDAAAAAELVGKYERAVRVAVRVRLTDPKLRRQFDSLDVCQSVLASFFVRVAAGRFDLRSPQQLVGLLVKMAENKLLMQVRRAGRLKRDVGREEREGPPLPDLRPGPDRIAAGRELLARVLAGLPAGEREVARLRAAGHTWEEIAAALRQKPDAVRIRFTRALDRLADETGP